MIKLIKKYSTRPLLRLLRDPYCGEQSLNVLMLIATEREGSVLLTA